MNILRIGVIGLLPFPDGGAPTSRLRSICLGLKEAGAEVDVFAFQSGNSIDSVEKKIIWRGINCSLYRAFSIAFKKQKLMPMQILRRFSGQRQLSEGMSQIYFHVKNLCEEKLVDAIFVYNQEPEFAVKLLNICHRNNIPYFQQYAEHHMLKDIQTIGLIPYWIRQQVHIKTIPSKCDGNIVISSYLKQKCEETGARSVLVVPALKNTEMSPATNPDKPTTNEIYNFVYVGRGDRRDCIKIIIDTAATLKEKGYSFSITMLGLSNQNKKIVSEYVNKLGLVKYIDARGWVSETELIKAYEQCDAFLLLRTNDQSSQASFPTRLPEFLSYAKPVVLSAIGDFPLYFTDEVNALLVATSSSASLVAQKMMMLIEDPGLGIKIGENGLELADEVFSYSLQGKKMYEYIKIEVCRRKKDNVTSDISPNHNNFE